ncbi:hypothetical protein AAG570_003193 [Ranatra chinensis]|uniref:Hydrophobin n=1 Tax=Ranatra chinensis TaxID=642074 RepID=A0ABD0Y6I5_9HEMI
MNYEPDCTFENGGRLKPVQTNKLRSARSFLSGQIKSTYISLVYYQRYKMKLLLMFAAAMLLALVEAGPSDKVCSQCAGSPLHCCIGTIPVNVNTLSVPGNELLSVSELFEIILVDFQILAHWCVSTAWIREGLHFNGPS